MVGLFLSILIAVGLLLTLALMARRRRGGATTAVGAGVVVTDARGALTRLQTGLLPQAFVSRLFAREDLDFVLANAPSDVQQRFLAERKRIAIGWVARVREEILELKRFHLGQARLHAKMGLRSELSLTFDFWSLLATCRVLETSLKLRGPYAAPGMVHGTMTAAARLCATSQSVLDTVAAQVQASAHRDRAEAAS
jgi:hypothetical protein